MVVMPALDPSRDSLRHAVATLAYRGGKAVRGAPSDFGDFRAGGGGRTAGAILSHIGDLLDWALSIARSKQEFHVSDPLAWEQEAQRFFASLTAFDAYLASPEPLGAPAEQLFQGPVADALTHVGQITMLRRLSGAPIRGENYFQAEIVAGRVGPEQAAPRKEFD